MTRPEPDAELRQLVRRYLDNIASLPERRQVERLMAADPRLADYVRRHSAVWDQVGAVPESVGNPDTPAAWNALATRIQAADRAAVRTRRRQIVRPSFVAAVAAALVVASIAGVYRTTLATRLPIGRLVAERADQGETVSTKRGQRLSLWLPDGTQLVLGPDSRLRYDVSADTDARATPRQVWLTGEAVFRVVHRPARPFIVHTDAGLTAEDLGTTFVVESYPDAPVRVAVDTGLVGLHVGAPTAGGRPAAVVAAGFVGTFEPRRRTVAIASADRGHFFGWTQGALSYSETPLGDVAAGLGRAYDLDIRIVDSGEALRRRIVNFAVDGESADQALGVLVRALPGVRYERTGRVVTLFRR